MRLLFPCLLLTFAFAWFAGGPTVDVTSIDEWVELASIPLLLLAACAWATQPPEDRLQRFALAAALAIACVPLLQLLPIPASLWGLPDARAAAARDMASAAVQLQDPRWTLMPQATERSLWALLPALACFLAASRLDMHQVRRLIQCMLAFVLANLAFGFFQVGLPASSPLRLYPEIGSGFGGVLVNDNHQGTALVIGMLVALGLWAETRRRQRRGETLPLRGPAYAASALLCVAAIPLTGSRAAMVIALAASAACCAATGLLPLHRVRRSRRAMAAATAAMGVLLLGLWSTWRWMQVDASDELRHALARETLRIGADHAPLGSGLGSFVPVFAQSASSLFQTGEYVNHAHNEFAQWWLEGGALAMLVLLGVLVVFAWLGGILLRHGRERPSGVACWLAVLAVLAHSVVDFPMRTLTLMTATAVLAGIAAAAAASWRMEGHHHRRHRTPAPEPA